MGSLGSEWSRVRMYRRPSIAVEYAMTQVRGLEEMGGACGVYCWRDRDGSIGGMPVLDTLHHKHRRNSDASSSTTGRGPVHFVRSCVDRGCRVEGGGGCLTAHPPAPPHCWGRPSGAWLTGGWGRGGSQQLSGTASVSRPPTKREAL
jgi:hypothetical protein